MNKYKIGLKRKLDDKFYTRRSTVKLIKTLIKSNLKIKSDDLVIEPSAGNGSFIPMIKKLTLNYKLYDLYPEHHLIIKKDFLKIKTKFKNKQIHVIGNPPFGRQSSLAIKFIKKSTKFANSISFILPKSFKKQSMQKYFDLHFHLIKQIDLLPFSFRINSKPYDVPCILTHYFIKFLGKFKINKIIKILNKIKFDFDNTVGPRSINKQELIEKFNKIL